MVAHEVAWMHKLPADGAVRTWPDPRLKPEVECDVVVADGDAGHLVGVHVDVGDMRGGALAVAGVVVGEFADDGEVEVLERIRGHFTLRVGPYLVRRCLFGCSAHIGGVFAGRGRAC